MRTAIVSSNVEVPVFDLPEPDAAAIARANAMIEAAKAPILYFGGGIPIARAEGALRAFAQRTHSLGRDPEGARRPADRRARLPRHDGHARQPRGQYRDRRMRLADLRRRPVRRPRDRQDRHVRAARPKVIHIDGDPAEIGKLKRPEVGIAGDLNKVLDRLTAKPADISRLAGALRRLRTPLGGALRRARHRHLRAGDAQGIVRGGGRQSDHHLRRRPAPDVGRPALPLQPPAGAPDQRRPRHDGLRHPGRHRRLARRSDAPPS